MAVMVAVPAFLLFVSYRSGQLDSVHLGFPLAFFSLIAFAAFRWSRMRRDFAWGRFTETDFKSNPVPIIIGSPSHAIFWFLFTIGLVFVPVVWRIVFR